MNRGEIRIDSGDAFAADDHFYFSIERSDPRPVLFVHAARDGRDLLYYRTALESARDAAFTLRAASRRPGRKPGARALRVRRAFGRGATFPPASSRRLRGYVRAGGSVLVALGPSSAARKRVPVFDEPIRETRYASRDGERFQTVATLDPAHPATRQASNWDDVKFYRSVRVEPGTARVLARLSDETPLLLEKQIGEGRVLVFASTFDNISNDFPLHAASCRSWRRRRTIWPRLDDRPANFTVGSYLELRTGREPGAAVEVLDPHGTRA